MPGAEEHLEALFAAGRSAWPNVPLDRETFMTRAQRTLSAADIAAVDVERAGDLFLAFACAEHEPRALAAFDQRYLSRVPAYLARLRKPPAFVDEITQRLREKLLLPSDRSPPRIEAYLGRGSLDGWLRIAAVRQALDHDDAERRHQPAPIALEEEAFGATADPELAYLKQRYLPHFREAFARAMARLAPDERNLLRFYLVDGLDLGQIAVVFEKSRATIGRRLIDCREKILEETRRELAGALGASPSEVSSLLKLIRSQLDASIRSMLQSRP